MRTGIENGLTREGEGLETCNEGGLYNFEPLNLMVFIFN